ncbi:hypothetical protein COT72_00890 [archaeon CG10_big_fil_rev_8_21_14_0_10_43_11]|nr:MAG: hypothetical protein COT72_00890 [archaeon CG10_big_fil_rev_8_21_14_0_10_43_11]
MKLSIQLVINTPHAKHILKTLKPEIDDVNSKRSTITYHATKNEFVANISAPDVNALRASINSHLLWIKTIQTVIEYGNTPRN